MAVAQHFQRNRLLRTVAVLRPTADARGRCHVDEAAQGARRLDGRDHARAGGDALLDCLKGQSILQPALQRRHGRRAGVKPVERGCVMKLPPAPIVEEALSRRALSQDHGMMAQFDMVIGHALDRLSLRDRDAIHQTPGWNQLAVDEHAMAGRNPQVPPWHIIGQGAALDAHGQHEVVSGDERARVVPAANPDDRFGGAGAGNNAVADLQGLDGDLAAIRQNGGAGAIAGRTVARFEGTALAERLGAGRQRDTVQLAAEPGAAVILAGRGRGGDEAPAADDIQVA